jgi:hypothetical protein
LNQFHPGFFLPFRETEWAIDRRAAGVFRVFSLLYPLENPIRARAPRNIKRFRLRDIRRVHMVSPRERSMPSR